MKKILIINTGGTFNKIYNPITGELDIDTKNNALKSISQAWLIEFNTLNIIGKDSLEMTQKDREEILYHIKQSSYQEIIIVHGTDTMDQTAKYLAEAKLNKRIVLTGSMVPFSINSIEASVNFASAYGFLQGVQNSGVYIAMNGKIGTYLKIQKNKEKGFFELTNVKAQRQS
jgi:L-asparaginase